MSTNIRRDHVSAFEALTSGDYRNFALQEIFFDPTCVYYFNLRMIRTNDRGET